MKSASSLTITKGFLATLALAQEGFLGECNKLCNKQELEQIYKDDNLIPLCLAPSGKDNQNLIQNAKKGDLVDLICEDKKVGEIKVESSFKIDKLERIKRICGIFDESSSTTKRLLELYGEYGVSGDFWVDTQELKQDQKALNELIKNLNAKKITGIFIGTNPLNRAHERIIRMALDECDLVVIFLTRPYIQDGLSYALRKKCLEHLIDKYIISSKITIIPLENIHIFLNNANILYRCKIAAKFGCNKLIIGQNHTGTGLYYEQNQPHSILDTYKKNLPLEVVLLPKYVFCVECKALVSVKTCPHGMHKHINYHGNSLKKLIFAGILPPAIFIRKDISSILLSELFSNRILDIQYIYDHLFVNSGLIEDYSYKDFYENLINLYQISSLD